jgi:4-hydroxybenzoate polyprenyltransferase
MFLNDAVDQGFDRRYRPERPIVTGRISSRMVWGLSFLWLMTGWVTFLPLGKVPTLTASLLLLTIVLYDFVHKRTSLAPVLMASCRFLLYLAAGSAAAGNANPSVLWGAAGLAAYILGLSYLARGESTGARLMRWTVVLLFMPALIAAVHPSAAAWGLWTLVMVQADWTLWCLFSRKPKVSFAVPGGVAGLLAGIALVDWLAAVGHGFAVAFLCLFLLALLLQRVAPAT